MVGACSFRHCAFRQKKRFTRYSLTLTPTQSSMFFLIGCKIRKKLTNQ